LKKIPIASSDFEEILANRRRFIVTRWDAYKFGSVVRLCELLVGSDGAVRRLTGEYLDVRVKLCDDRSVGIERRHCCLGFSPCFADLLRSRIYRLFFAEKPAPPGDADENGGEGGSFYPLSLLKKSETAHVNADEVQRAIVRVMDAFRELGASVGVRDVSVGARCLTFALYPKERGAVLRKIMGLKDDVAFALGVPGARLFPKEGKIFLEIPKNRADIVRLGDCLTEEKARSNRLMVPLGLDTSGNTVTTDLAALPHLLVGGTTGSGKSVAMNAILLSLLRHPPDALRLILIDPKRVEFAPYQGLPHLEAPVCQTAAEAVQALRQAAGEMERRYELLRRAAALDLPSFNKWKRRENRLPRLVIAADEYADLSAGEDKKDVKALFQRLAQKGRAAGIHLILATQRPDANVLDGVIKANFPGRIALQVGNKVNSKIILDRDGAEELLGDGDMLFTDGKMAEPIRLQGCFVSAAEIRAVTSSIAASVGQKLAEPAPHEAPADPEAVRREAPIAAEPSAPEVPAPAKSTDETLFEQAVAAAKRRGCVSVPILKTELGVGYEKAKKAFQMMENCGLLGPEEPNKPRPILFDEPRPRCLCHSNICPKSNNKNDNNYYYRYREFL
jgi:S-DNA-T family DNA segregation ATPase FtsK/SpoIIIE